MDVSTQSLHPEADLYYNERGAYRKTRVNHADPLLQPQRYQFNFSTRQETDGRSTCCRITTISILSLTAVTVPAVYFYGLAITDDDFVVPLTVWITYIFVLNTLALIGLGKYAVSSFAYPFSNNMIRNN